ncbi:MAG TPA: hypothetical protein PLD77_01625 [Candidatus Dojkabacteria bacterium]|nr:hypothetical protein [Candidatus Dojkabacteria bacterium]
MKLGKPSKKSVIIACSIVAVAGCGIAYYVISRDKQSVARGDTGNQIPIVGSATVVNTSNKVFFSFSVYGANVVISDPDPENNNRRTISGYAWSEDIGWIKFTQGETDGVFVDNATGAVSGSAYVLNTGNEISFSTNNSNTFVNIETGAFSGYAWSKDVGWIDFETGGVLIADQVPIVGSATVVNTSNKVYFSSSEYGANVVISDPDPTNSNRRTISGYAWSEDIGWIMFAQSETSGVFVDNATGAVSGSAYVLNTGNEISFSTNNSNTFVNIETGAFSGYAWSKDVGWIDFETGGVYIANQAPNAPTSLLTNSLTNPTGVSKNPGFSAVFSDPDSADKGKSYQIQVNTSSSFDGTMIWDSGQNDFTTLVNNASRSEDIQFPTDTLNWGVTYYWRIKMWDNKGAISDWSETGQFTMNYKPSPTDLRVNGEVSPVGVDITINPMFTAIYNDVDPADTCITYQIQMNTTSAFDGIMKWDTEVLEMPGPIANGSTIPAIEYDGTPMLNGITYYWRIKLGDDKGAMSDWSETGTFRSNYQPNKPTGLLVNGLVNPVGVGLNPLPTFSGVFSDPDGTDVCATYQIQLNTRSTFDGTMKWDSQVIDVEGVIGNNERIPEVSYGAYGGSELQGGTTYYWRMKLGDNKHTQSEWSDVMEFKTNYEPNIPTELLTEGQVNPEKVSLSPTFSARYTDNDLDNTAVAYQILVARTIEFTEPLVWDSGKTFFNEAIANGSRTPEIPYGGTEGILEGGRYYWKIRIWDEKDGVSRYSMVVQFGTHSRPSSPTGLEMNGTSTPGVLNSKKMSFSAIYYDEDGDRASAYQIQISTSSEFETVVLDSGKKSTNVASGTRSEQYYYDGSSLLNNSGTTYYWRIRFYDTDDMEGEWSSNGVFYDSLSPSSILFEGLQMEGIKVN